MTRETRERARARCTDPVTSHEAAEAVTKRLNALQRAVLRFAAAQGSSGFVDKDMESFFENGGATYRTRRRELVDKGLVIDTGLKVRLQGERRHRKVWRIARFPGGATT